MNHQQHSDFNEAKKSTLQRFFCDADHKVNWIIGVILVRAGVRLRWEVIKSGVGADCWEALTLALLWGYWGIPSPSITFFTRIFLFIALLIIANTCLATLSLTDSSLSAILRTSPPSYLSYRAQYCVYFLKINKDCTTYYPWLWKCSYFRSFNFIEFFVFRINFLCGFIYHHSSSSTSNSARLFSCMKKFRKYISININLLIGTPRSCYSLYWSICLFYWCNSDSTITI